MGTVNRNHVGPTTGRSDDHRMSKDLKLSFAKLAASQAERNARTPQPQAATGAASGRSPEQRRQLYTRAGEFLTHVFQAVRDRRAASLEPGLALMKEMAVDYPQPDELFIAALHADAQRQFAIRHSVNVAVYALKMAQGLGFELESQIRLGMAGLLHDIGMALIPESTIGKQGQLSASERKILQDRPNSAYAILQGFGPDYADIAECAAQVYERADGSGRPRGLKADEINEYAKIIGLVDMYEALVHTRPNREKLSFFEAAKYLFKSCKAQFDRHYMKALLRQFTVFPVYSYVQLNSEAIGKVLETYPDQPMRPKLQLVFDSQRRKILSERIVALPEAPLLNIVRCVPENEIRELAQGITAVRSMPEESCDTVEEPIM